MNRFRRYWRIVAAVGTAWAGAAVIHTICGFLLLDSLLPMTLPDAGSSFAVTVTARDGTPLRSFPDEEGVWRYPVTRDRVSPLYLQALINYEDRWFYHHPGVNPLALVRASFQYLRAGRLISGGSTLTMQVARILHPHSRTMWGKLYQMFRALQLEYHLDKERILEIYLNHAPFGGPIEGVEAASYAYLDKPSRLLSHAEAALLAVLPQSPTRLRPDRHPERATRARDKVLDRMERFGVWDAETVAGAKVEQVMAWFDPRPLSAPLLSRRLRGDAVGGEAVRTLIDPMIQAATAELIRDFAAGTPSHTSAAALVVENRNMAVRAYVGSADFLDAERFGHVDMIQAVRSPGSTLKPFLYGMALEDGLIHSQSLLVDAPLSFTGYRPDNFTRHFTGPVSAAEALRRSLNLPAVDLLDRVGPRYFHARLRQGGMVLTYPPHQGPNLTMILGGVGTTLEELVSVYTAFARGGLAGRLRYRASDPVIRRYLISPGAAYIIRRILENNPRPDLPAGRVRLERSRQVAWKTGTSYGFRDAWTIGVTDQYTIGVWVGRPDGTPSPGQYGRATAAPLLFRIVDSLPRHGSEEALSAPVPDTVSREEICWPLGLPPNGEGDPLCHEKRTAWVLGGITPPTFPDRTDHHWQPNPLTVMVNPQNGRQVEIGCPTAGAVPKQIARWPRSAEPWLTPRQRRLSALPPLDPACGVPVSDRHQSIRILGIEPDTVFRPPGSETRLPSVTLQAQGVEGRSYWLLNDDLICRTEGDAVCHYQFDRPGRYRLTVMDEAGNHDMVRFHVIGGR